MNQHLFPANVTRAAMERELPYNPKPDGSPLTLENGVNWIKQADDTLQACTDAIEAALMDKARLLNSPALRQRLEQGKSEKIVADLLKAQSAEEMAGRIVSAIKKDQGPELVRLLNLYLQKINVRKIRLSDFKPTKQTFERADVDTVSDEFKSFLLENFKGEADGEISVAEIE